MLPGNLPERGYTPDRQYYVTRAGRVYQKVCNSNDWFTRYQLVFDPNRENTMTETTTSTVVKELSSGLIVSSNEFARLGPLKQTETLASANGKPVVFVKNFNSLRDKKSIVERLLKGEDVAMELEFNEITLTTEEQAALAQVLPVIERIRGAQFGNYKWCEPDENQLQRIKNNLYLTASRVQRNGYELSRTTSLRIWNIASKYWNKLDNGEEAATPAPINGISSFRRRVIFSPTGIELGCQSIPRAEVEHIAKHFEFEPNVEG